MTTNVDTKDKKAIKANYNKKYYNKDKTKTSDRLKSSPCDICGGAYSYYSKSKHLKSKKHKLAMYEKNLLIHKQD